MKWEYRNLQFKTVPGIGAWSRLAERDLQQLEALQNDGWEVHQVVNIRGSFGFTAHLVFMLRRELSSQ